jgi:hypothetical protein
MIALRGLLAGWQGYAAIAALSALVAFGAGWRLRGWKEAPVISAAEVRASNAERDLAQVNTIVARAEAAQERRRAEAETKAREQIEDYQQQVTVLRAQVAKDREMYEREATRLLQELYNVPQSETRELGPRVLRYLDGVRIQQGAAAP